MARCATKKGDGIERLLWADIRPGGGHLHVARTTFGRPRAQWHRHDFAEVFWVEQGSGVHLVNAGKQKLEPGVVLLIRPDDAHAFRVNSGAGLTFVNVAFPAARLDRLRRAYFAGGDAWPWAGGELPATYRLNVAQVRRLSAQAEGLSMARESALEIDWFLLGLLREVAAPLPPAAGNEPPPAWLSEALQLFSQPVHLAEGPAGLSRLAGYCPEHVNRVVQRCYGKRATDLVNDLRLEYASRQLRLTDEPIAAIAAAAGLSNLGYFYKLFGERFGTTPRGYRRSYASVV